MLIRLITVGKLKEKYLRDGVAEYVKRLQAYTRVQLVEIPDQRIPEGASSAEEQIVLAREGEGILKYLGSPGTGVVVAPGPSGAKLFLRGTGSLAAGNYVAGAK